MYKLYIYTCEGRNMMTRERISGYYYLYFLAGLKNIDELSITRFVEKQLFCILKYVLKIRKDYST